MNVLFYSVIATVIVSLISLIGALFFAVKQGVLDKAVYYLVAISAGSMIGGAFLHLIPEALESVGYGPASNKIFFSIVVGFILFFILERVLHWHHCHKHGGECEVHTFTYMNLIGDGFHNFIDGVVIAAAFSLSVELGIATTLSVVIHEIPQEISDFGVLIYGGFSRAKALALNLLSGILAVGGALFGVALARMTEGVMPILAALTAGGFIYVAASDLIPELHKESKLAKSMAAFVCFLVGVGLMVLLKFGHAG